MKKLIQRILAALEGVVRIRAFWCVEIQSGEARRVRIRERDGAWVASDPVVVPGVGLSEAAMAGHWFEKGLFVVDSSVPAWFEPPSQGGPDALSKWLETTRPPDGVEVEPMLPEKRSGVYAAWVRVDGLGERCHDLPGEPDRLFLDLAQISVLCAPGGIEGAWMVWRVGANSSVCWWMMTDKICYACRLLGGRSDPPLLEKELRSVLGDGGPIGWEKCPVAFLENVFQDRLESLLVESGRIRVDFPLAERWRGVPGGFLIAAASVEGEGLVESAIDGPIERSRRDRVRAVRAAVLAIIGLSTLLVVWAAASAFGWRAHDRRIELEAALTLEKQWLDELDSLRSSSRFVGPVPASRFLSEVARCLPNDALVLDWSTSGMPRHHAIVLEALDEQSVPRISSCIDSSILFKAPMIRSTEVRTIRHAGKATSLAMVHLDVSEEEP